MAQPFEFKREELPADMGFWYKPNSPFIYCTITRDQKRHAFSTKTTEVKKALMERANKERELDGDGAFKKSKGKMSAIFDAYVAYLEEKEEHGSEYKRKGRTNSSRVRSVLRSHLEKFFGPVKISDAKNRIKEYNSLRLKEKASAPALNGEYRILSAALNRGLVDGTVSRDDIPVKYPFRHAEEKQAARTGTISPEQYTKIMAELAPHLKPVFAVAVETGMRPKEISFIRTSQIFLDGDDPRIELRAGETKNRKARTVPIIQTDVIEILKAWEEQRSEDVEWFFQSDDGKQLGDPKTAWYAALRRAGIPKNTVMFYDARRTAETKFDDHDVAPEDAQMAMGHNAEMRGRYNQSKKALKRMREKMTPKITAVPAPVAPGPSEDDLEASLAKLKKLFDRGLLPESVYVKKVSDLVG